jgi:type VI secretion system secreted protein Hcp
MITASTKNSVRSFALLALLVATTLLPVSANAIQLKSSPDFKMYLQVEGVVGDVTEPGFEKAIEIVAYSWGASQSGSFVGGGSGGGKPNFQDLSMRKYFDASTPPLLLALAKGTHIPKATLTLVRRVNGAADKFMVFAATDVLVTSLSTGASASEDSGTLVENVTIAFGQAKLTYKNLDGTTSEVTLNVAGGTAN